MGLHFSYPFSPSRDVLKDFGVLASDEPHSKLVGFSEPLVFYLAPFLGFAVILPSNLKEGRVSFWAKARRQVHSGNLVFFSLCFEKKGVRGMACDEKQRSPGPGRFPKFLLPAKDEISFG